MMRVSSTAAAAGKAILKTSVVLTPVDGGRRGGGDIADLFSIVPSYK